MTDTDKLTTRQVSESEGLDDWRVLLRTLQTSFKTGSMAKGMELAARIGAAADEMNHHPDLTITYPRVHVLLTSHDVDALSTRDVELARTISAIARDLGVTAEPGVVTQLEIAIDAIDIPAVKPFWEAVLGYKPHLDDDSLDPYGAWSRVLVPADGRASPTTQPHPHRRHRPARRRAAAHRRRARRGWNARVRRGRAGVLDPRRSRGQRGLHLHLARTRLSSARRDGGCIGLR